MLAVSLKYRLQKIGVAKFHIFDTKGKRLLGDYYEMVGERSRS